MTEYREEVVRRRVGDEIVEEVVETPVVAPVASQVVTRPVRRRWWRRTRTPIEPAPAVVSTEYYAAPTYTVDPALTQFVRIMWFALGVLEGLLALRFVLALLGANPTNQFASLVYAITGPFVLPFRTLFTTPTANGSVFEFYTLIAMAVYFLLWWAIVKFIGVATNRWVDV